MELLDEEGKLIRRRLKPISDIFRRERGGSSEFLDLYCSNCDSYIGTYQKDGSGNLFRLYVDRLQTPYEKYTAHFENIKDMEALNCPNPSCVMQIGIPMVYEKENRLAYRLVSSIRKTKNHSGKYPPESIGIEDLFIES